MSEAIRRRGLQVHTSRCGDFRKALALLRDNPELADILEARLITHRFDLPDLADAFQVAADSSKSIKVLISVDSPK